MQTKKEKTELYKTQSDTLRECLVSIANSEVKPPLVLVIEGIF
jgi:hypothetical protein